MSPRTLLLAAVLCPVLASADDVPVLPGGTPVAGHSTHGDAFDEGPRQAAVLLGGMGAIRFPITTQSGDAQKFFDQGVAQLHGFWYDEAERSFRQAAKLDDTAPMPYWGMAMANVNNAKRAAEFIRQAVTRREKGSPRERLYIDAYSAWHTAAKKDEPAKKPEPVGKDAAAKQPEPAKQAEPAKKDDPANKARRTALVKALEKIVFEFPDDIEAKAFLIFHVWDNSQKRIPLPSHAASTRSPSKVLAKNPMHPVAPLPHPSLE